MQLIDQYNREISYLRISVTDRCDLRCVYCMKEKMTFLPKKEILTGVLLINICFFAIAYYIPITSYILI